MNRTWSLLALLWPLPLLANPVTLATGGEQGIYHQVAREFCRLANKSDPELQCKPQATSGSIENLRQLQAGQTSYALVQSDWLYQASKGLGPYVSLEQLKLAPIDMGLKSSGTRQTALALFDLLGAKEQDLDLKSAGNLVDALCSKQIDAYGLVMGHPNRIVLDTAKRCAIRFLPIEGTLREQLIKGVKYYQRSQVPARIYPGNLKATPTFAIAATLVTNAATPEADVYRLTRAMLTQQTNFNEQTYGYANLFHKARNKTGPVLSIEQHPGAAKYFEELKTAGKL
ncbi:TPA: TAXI family TRAP transporter solute-binding subunit [Aeromonas salmonicida]|uniref:TAXI family TRAP transporter solute-binding subunit n=1 Tax=Aeromonas salmonicida TaxID=645 RepID=UPI0004485B7C|nr:TAXI family TRAP transporter solute-binding subunit [Aeromonas salmonicida]ELI6404934.1 TAXI family TRAP transporter solute-binding subunit [Aeromonas salmonicida subsp. salmonicida]ASI22078.1 TRAP transporter substrate-binding protein [Aeromonas salmonicida]ASI26393.1 TRAP transporter substrate-binding protein [Aeromonas salmonicida]ASI30512.1 TRAP transporter substrate-binding protein [Aeromonas salmonicida]ATD37758.1 TRAP ABC transporter substrate-binding protein [Aeromonas salmonicida s